jgi:hypothetical protein
MASFNGTWHRDHPKISRRGSSVPSEWLNRSLFSLKEGTSWLLSVRIWKLGLGDTDWSSKLVITFL